MEFMEYELSTDVANFASATYKTTKDINVAVEKAAKKFHITNEQVIKVLPLELYVKVLIANKAIPDIENYKVLRDIFSDEWLDAVGNID